MIIKSQDDHDDSIVNYNSLDTSLDLMLLVCSHASKYLCRCHCLTCLTLKSREILDVIRPSQTWWFSASSSLLFLWVTITQLNFFEADSSHNRSDCQSWRSKSGFKVFSWHRPVAGLRGREVPTVVTSSDDLVAILDPFVRLVHILRMAPAQPRTLLHHEQTCDLGVDASNILLASKTSNFASMIECKSATDVDISDLTDPGTHIGLWSIVEHMAGSDGEKDLTEWLKYGPSDANYRALYSGLRRRIVPKAFLWSTEDVHPTGDVTHVVVTVQERQINGDPQVWHGRCRWDGQSVM